MTSNYRVHLAGLIREFLKEFAGRAASDPTEYSSPDAVELERFAFELETVSRPALKPPFSEWGSGGYKPYTSKRGRELHDAILKLCTAIRYHD